jgi:hypothetical protein
MWGHAGILVNQTTFDNASAIRVCQPGPVAFQRANVSGGNRREIDVRALPNFGRPRGFNILAAVPAANDLRQHVTSLASACKGFFRPCRVLSIGLLGIGLRFISLTSRLFTLRRLITSPCWRAAWTCWSQAMGIKHQVQHVARAGAFFHIDKTIEEMRSGLISYKDNPIAIHDGGKSCALLASSRS